MGSAVLLDSWSCQKGFLYCERTENVEFSTCQLCQCDNVYGVTVSKDQKTKVLEGVQED